MVMQKNHTNSYTFLTLYIPIDQFEGWDSNARNPLNQNFKSDALEKHLAATHKKLKKLDKA